MSKKLLSLLILLGSGALPLTVFAFTFPGQPGSNKQLNISNIVDSIFGIIWPIVVFIVIIMFIYAGFLFLTAAGNSSQIDTAKKAVMWGAVGVGVILISFSVILMLRVVIGV